MELDFELKLPLKEIVKRRIAVILWNKGDDISALFEKLPFRFLSDKNCESEWRESIENQIKGGVLKLALPKSLSKEMMRLVRPIGSEIWVWKIFHEKFLGMWRQDFNTRIVKHLCWTSAGTIDYRKTARKLVRFEMLDVVKRYKLACLYCLEDDILTLWKGLPEKSKKCFYEGVSLRAQELQMEFYWSCVLHEEESKLDCAPERGFANLPLCQEAFESSAVKGNQAATEYFFQKLTFEERETSLARTTKAVLANRDVESRGPLKEFPKEKLCDIFCYLLFLMTPKQRMAIFKEFPFEVLKIFFDWPRHDHLTTVSDIVFAFPPENVYESYLRFDSSNGDCKSYNPPMLFLKFFLLSPTNFKKYFVDRECQDGHFLCIILYSADCAKTVFRNLDAKDRVRLLSCRSFCQLVDYLIFEDKFELVESCVREAMLTKEDRTSLKEIYAKFSIDFGLNSGKRIIEILDEMDAK